MTIVVGFDASPAAAAALDAAADIASRYGEDLVIVYGVEPPAAGVGEELRSHEAALEEVGRRLTSAAVTRSRERGVAASVMLVRDRPARALVQVAQERGARLIAVGTYGESPLRGAILGSTPHKLLHISPLPVLVVPADEDVVSAPPPAP